MNRLLKELNWDELIAKDDVFTERNKREIRQRISKVKKDRMFFKNTFMNFLSISVVSIFLIAVTGVIVQDSNPLSITNGSSSFFDLSKKQMTLDEYMIYLKEKERLLAEMGLPLEGENIFIPNEIIVNQWFEKDKVRFSFFQWNTKPYDPIEYVQASFIGEFELVGKFQRTSQTINGIPNPIIFVPDESTSKKLPKSHHDLRAPLILIKNQELAESILKKAKSSVPVTIIIDEFEINYQSKHSLDSAKLISVEELN